MRIMNVHNLAKRNDLSVSNRPTINRSELYAKADSISSGDTLEAKTNNAINENAFGESTASKKQNLFSSLVNLFK